LSDQPEEHFCGSYQPDDVTFLLRVIDMPPTPLAERERRIQAGEAHYSEMIGRESLPTQAYLNVFRDAARRCGPDLAEHLAALAAIINAGRSGPLTLVSLARAGTPVGVLLRRVLLQYFQRDVQHYSISIIRDRGLDEKALDHILEAGGRPDSSLVFVDGWTGKGVISRELGSAVEKYNKKRGVNVSPELHVLTDLCGEAGVAVGCRDFLVPSSILNSTVSGLISRTILNADYLGPRDFHGCLYYAHWAGHDLSQDFVDQMMAEVKLRHEAGPLDSMKAAPLSPARRAELRRANQAFLERAARRHGAADPKFIKPGLGEATRVMLRRVPDVLILKDPDHIDVRHLRLLAEDRGVPVELDPGLPYQAAALIKAVSHD
jgi:hypothetical protein